MFFHYYLEVSERISCERGESIGDNIGYKVRLQSKGGRHSSVVFCTNGILLRVLVGKGSVSYVSDITHIIVDEIHERDCYSDFMLAIIRDLLPSNPHLHLILMSATLDAERFPGYFGGCPVVRVPGFTHPVRSLYLEDVLSILKPGGDNHLCSTNMSIPDQKLDLTVEAKLALDEASILFKVRHPRENLPPHLGASIACILSYDGHVGVSSPPESMRSKHSRTEMYETGGWEEKPNSFLNSLFWSLSLKENKPSSTQRNRNRQHSFNTSPAEASSMPRQQNNNQRKPKSANNADPGKKKEKVFVSQTNGIHQHEAATTTKQPKHKSPNSLVSGNKKDNMPSDHVGGNQQPNTAPRKAAISMAKHQNIKKTKTRSGNTSDSGKKKSVYVPKIDLKMQRETRREMHEEPRVKTRKRMAYSACFLHQSALSSTERSPSFPSSLRHMSFSRPVHVVCRAQQVQEDVNSAVSRRLALTFLVGAAAVGSKVSPADAAYGEAANVFGKPKKNTDFMPYNGEGFKIEIPSKWNPSKEVEYPGQVLRYEDNFDATSNVSVMITPTDKKTIADYGSPEQFLSQVSYLLGKQAYFGETASEGGFDANAVATANILETSTQEVGGKKYYYLSVLTRTADGDEGGKHQLITATVNGGKLYICKAQAGDKRWFKGARKFVENAATSFSVA
ncbi:unnamed protein product [Brassica oleracea]